LNDAALSVSDNFDSVSECAKGINELLKLHIQGVWQIANEFIMAHARCNGSCLFIVTD